MRMQIPNQLVNINPIRIDSMSSNSIPFHPPRCLIKPTKFWNVFEVFFHLLVTLSDQFGEIFVKIKNGTKEEVEN